MSYSVTKVLLVSGLLSCALGACQSDADTRVALAGLSSSCRINSDCSELLVCVFESCHQACITSRDCEAGQRCVETAQKRNVCQLPEERDCSSSGTCKGTQVCGPDAQCRDACASSDDCIAGQLCSSGTCAEQAEVDEDGRLPAAPERAPLPAPCAYDSDCPGSSVCVAGACRSECTGDADCEAGQACHEGSCINPPTAPVACLRSSDCKADERCDGGVCEKLGPAQTPQCRYDSECNTPGQRCAAGRCTCACAETSDCPHGRTCDGCACVPARVVQGNLIVSNETELRTLDDVTEITGMLIFDIRNVGDYHFPALRRVGSIAANFDQATIHFDALEEASGNINCYQDCRLPKLKVANGDILFNTQSVRQISLPALETARDFTVWQSDNVTRISLPKLRTARGLSLQRSGKLTQLETPLLAALETLSVDDVDSLRVLELPLAAPTYSVSIIRNQLLTTVSLPSVKTVGFELSLLWNPSLSSVDLSGLERAENLEFQDLPKLTNLQLSSLQKAPSRFRFESVGGPSQLSLPALTEAGVTSISAGGISKFSAPNLSTLTELAFNQAPALTSFDLSSLRSVGAVLINQTGLTSFATLDKLTVAEDLQITDNWQLPVCSILKLKQYLQDAGFTGDFVYDGYKDCARCVGWVCQ